MVEFIEILTFLYGDFISGVYSKRMDIENNKDNVSTDIPEYRKDFEKWNIAKQKIDVYPTTAFIQESAIWLASIGVNVGFEMDGKGNDFVRPILIIKKINHETCIGIPITSKKKESAYRVDIDILGEAYQAVISQVRSFDRKRLLRYMSKASTEDFNAVVQELIHILPKDETPNIAGMSGESRLPFGANMDSVADDELNAS
jgi:mRNA-degrading endonuclease toxin of MazEF toxin-antitoxin module